MGLIEEFLDILFHSVTHRMCDDIIVAKHLFLSLIGQHQ